MTLSDDLAYDPAHELAARNRRRDLSPVEVVDAFIARIEARNPSLNALVYLGFDDAHREAKADSDPFTRMLQSDTVGQSARRSERRDAAELR